MDGHWKGNFSSTSKENWSREEGACLKSGISKSWTQPWKLTAMFRLKRSLQLYLPSITSKSSHFFPSLHMCFFHFFLGTPQKSPPITPVLRINAGRHPPVTCSFISSSFQDFHRHCRCHWLVLWLRGDEKVPIPKLLKSWRIKEGIDFNKFKKKKPKKKSCGKKLWIRCEKKWIVVMICEGCLFLAPCMTLIWASCRRSTQSDQDHSDIKVVLFRFLLLGLHNSLLFLLYVCRYFILYVCLNSYVYVYVCIYIERERERARFINLICRIFRNFNLPNA